MRLIEERLSKIYGIKYSPAVAGQQGKNEELKGN